MSQSPSLDHIAKFGDRGHHHGWPARSTSDIVCKDGTSLSVTAGNGLYCAPRPPTCMHGYDENATVQVSEASIRCDYPGPYTMVEVYSDDPDLVGTHAEGGPHSIYCDVDTVRGYIIEHGGEWLPSDEAEKILRELGQA